jgi:hypothetical protein
MMTCPMRIFPELQAILVVGPILFQILMKIFFL